MKNVKCVLCDGERIIATGMGGFTNLTDCPMCIPGVWDTMCGGEKDEIEARLLEDRMPLAYWIHSNLSEARWAFKGYMLKLGIVRVVAPIASAGFFYWGMVMVSYAHLAEKSSGAEFFWGFLVTLAVCFGIATTVASLIYWLNPDMWK